MLKYFILIFCAHFGQYEGYTVVRDMQQYLKIEEAIIKHLKPFITQQENDLKLLRTQFGEFEKIHNDIKNATNPINSFLLTKRLTMDWENLKQMLIWNKNNVTAIQRKLKSATVIRFPFPTQSDLSAAASGLLRIQKTYKWNATDMIRGQVQNFKLNIPFSATDCYQMGVHAEMENDYENGLLWLTEAMTRSKNDSNIYDKFNFKADILDYLATCYFHLGQSQKALETANNLSLLMVGNDFALESITNFKKEVKEKKGVKNIKAPTRLEEHFDKLCRGDIKLAPVHEAPLRCKYLNRSPFLKLAPMKFEEVSIDPYIVIYYDLISDPEIKFLQEFSRGLLERTKVISANGTMVYTTTRTGQSAWIFDESPVQIQTIDKRIEILTGLTTKTAEPIQIVNYGLGGYYAPHMDYVGKDDTTSFPKIGNRIATLLFYLNDVPAGGATVFPSLNLSISPRKGSAAFWWNVDTSGDPDERTMHAACPVISGEKWVCNKWLHERGQEFLRPCLFEYV